MNFTRMEARVGEDFRIETIETRCFDSQAFVVPMEIEFCRNPWWADQLSSARVVSAEHVDGTTLLRLIARILVTGGALPSMTIVEGPHMPPAPISEDDAFRLALACAEFGTIPTEEDYSDSSDYLRFREVVESTLSLRHIHVALRRGDRRVEQERMIAAVAGRLETYSLATSSSPPLTFSAFAELLNKNKRLFSFSSGADALLGTSALASAYQLAILANPLVALQLAGAGAGAYVVLKFGAAVGKRMNELVRRL